MRRPWVSCLLFLLTAAPLSAQTSFPLTVSGNEASARITLPGGLGADLVVSFERAVGLTPAALQVTANVVLPLDTSVLPRLIAAGVALPSALPIVIKIEPSEASALSFEGVMKVGLHTHNLALRTDVPMSLFSASGGGPFRDITLMEGVGSYRVNGTSGSFSEFVIVVDPRPINSVISGKFDALSSLLDLHSGLIPPSVLSALQASLLQARLLSNAGQTVAAIAELRVFSDLVRAQSGTAIPNVWRANDPIVNVAGLLRAATDTLTFSLNRKTNLH